jgi:2-methylisocitrate lyase-like PEP mutase family enzyme
MMDQVAKAKAFQQLHLGPEILVIANAWDAGSARDDALPYPEANKLFD